ncbi:hypothetical protein DPMN_015286 [Dreissena polymorpha]|uniref:Uncharacterized protein n=2 Tax=Dreissena polymorpha TaxID=45954 RepID=A0A9D4S4A4_DREPO|nr:hypothetical protein DPMN_015286 [Dreissena polymorpha]
MPICGPKLSICCTLLSIWGIIQLALLGIFFQIHSPALFEDIPLKEEDWEEHNFSMSFVHEQYEKTAINCFIGAGIYVAFFIFSYCQFRMNSRTNYEQS